MRQNVCTASLILLSIGVVLLALGTVFAAFWPNIFNLILANELTLSPDARSYSQWKSPNVSLYFDIYLFNCTNSEEFVNDESVKLRFEQLGPYRFREIRDKVEINFDKHESTVRYRPLNTYFFVEEASVGSLDDVITNINIVVAGAAGQAANMDYERKKLVSFGFYAYQQTLFTSKTARELLFEGYEDDMVSMGKLGLIDGFDPNDIPYDRIGWFYTKNASTSSSGQFTMNTGDDDISKLGTINAFNRLNHHSFYTGQCAHVNGFIGELFSPLESKQSISLFLSDMCRTIPLDYEREVEVHGVPGYKFIAGKRAVDNGSIYSPNLCYSEGSTEHFPSGVMNISACRYSSPIFMSYPHFYDADPYYLENVEGLEPIKEKHQSHFTIEPLTGATLEVTMRFQANFLIKSDDDIAIFQNLPTLFIPAMWVEQKFVLDPETSKEIKIALTIPFIGRMVGLGLMALGIVFVIIAWLIRCISKCRGKRRENDVSLTTVGSRHHGDRSSPLLSLKNKNITIRKMNGANN